MKFLLSISFSKTIFLLTILYQSFYNVQCQSKCNLTIPFTKNDISGIVIKNPFYRDNIESCWFKVKVEEGFGLTVEFQNFTLQDKACFDEQNQHICCDYLQIGTGSVTNKNLFNTYCGSDRIEPIILNSNTVWFNFHTDDSLNFDGFKIKLNKFRLSFNESYGQIFSPEVPFRYTNNLNLTYTINTEENSLVFIRFEKFSIESYNNTCIDYLQVGSLGSKSIIPKKFCGEETPEPIVINSNKIYLNFYTDKSETSSGFSLYYNTIKNVFTEPTGVIETSQYPMNMTYKILAPEDKKIELTVEKFSFSKCFLNESDLLVASPNSACSLYNDHLVFSNEKGSLNESFYQQINSLYSNVKGNNISNNWVFCACNRPVRTYMSLTNELNIKLFLAKRNLDDEEQSYFKISYRFIPAKFSSINNLRIVQNQVKTSFIGGFLLNVRVPANNHLRLYGKSLKCSFPKQSLISKINAKENQSIKEIILASDDFKKTCSYLIDISEPKADIFVPNKDDWLFSWFLKFDSSFELYDFELNWMFIKNEILDEKQDLRISLPKQIGFDFNQYDELFFHFKSSNNNRKYSLSFNIDNKFVNDALDMDNYIKLRIKNTKQIDNLISVDHLNNKLNPYILTPSVSALKIKRNNKYSIEILCKMDQQIGDCNFDTSFCNYTTNLYLNTSLFPSVISSDVNGLEIKHMPKYDTLNTNDFKIADKAKDFYLLLAKNSEDDESIFSPLINVQQDDTDTSSFNKKVYSISFSYMISNNSKNNLELFIVKNRSDLKPTLKADFFKEIIAQYDSQSHLHDKTINLAQISNECPSTAFSSVLNSAMKTKDHSNSKLVQFSDLELLWYRVEKVKFFSCFDFRFGFGIVNQDKDNKISNSSASQIGIDDIEINEENELSACDSKLCSNNGNCYEYNSQPICCCNAGFEGDRCERKLSACEQAQSFLENTILCKNGGKCKNLANDFDYKCECPKGYTGRNCEIEINECEVNPCQNGGKCVDRIGSYECVCKNGFSGKNCQQKDLDCKEKCSEPGTSECFNDRSKVICKCKPDYTGDDCSFKIKINKCSSNPCVSDSKCVNEGTEFKCICPEDRTGKFCEVQLNFCKDHENLCKNGSACLYANQNGSVFSCSCAAGFTGPNCDVPINDCGSNPCLHGKCIDQHLGYKCECNKGYIGKNCDFMPKDPCYKNRCVHGTCLPSGANNYTCLCHNNFKGDFCEKEICNKKAYLKETCFKDGTLEVVASENKCICLCNKDYTGSRCEIRINLCELRPKNVEFEDECQNGGTCVYNNQTNQIKCLCKDGYFGDRCQITENHCKSNPCLYGNCRNEQKTYKCSCIRGWEGVNCEKQINACNLEEDCVSKNTQNVLYSKNTCVCLCKLGYTGDRCQTNINNCASDTCQNGGKCVDLVGSFECKCPFGFTGPFCEKKVEDCELNPCENGRCEMNGRSLTCICDKGYTGDFCEKFIDQCDPNPCKNGAKCHNLIDDYYCECPPEFGETKNCSIRLKNPCESSPCFHNGTCFPVASGSILIDGKSVNTFSGFKCRCATNYKGEFCELPADPCSSNPCNHRGQCVLSKDAHSYTCRCYPAFTGKNCETYFDPCASGNLCKNGGSCLATPEGYKCKCPTEFGGENCEISQEPCDLMKCLNGGQCVVSNNVPSCKCPNDRFIGTRCEIDISLINAKEGPLNSALKNQPISCDVLGNDVGTIDYVFLALIIFGLIILIITAVYMYVYLGIKRAKNYHKTVQYESDILGEMNDIEKRNA